MPTMSHIDLLKDPQVQARETTVQIDHPTLPGETVYGVYWKLSRTPGAVTRHAPLLGEHNEYVFGELLGMPKQEIERLQEEEIIY